MAVFGPRKMQTYLFDSDNTAQKHKIKTTESREKSRMPILCY